MFIFTVREYLHIAQEKYNYNPEQALGVLYWHKFDLECAMADLANYLPYPDEWSMEDRALFEQAYQFYNKNFHKINTLLPDKKISSLVKYYYTWKKVKTQSYIQRQINKKPSKTQDDSNDSVGGNDVVADSETEFEANGSTSGLKQECSLCQTRKPTTYFNTSQGLLCRPCFSAKRKDGSFNANSNEDFHLRDECKSSQDDSCLPNGMTKMLLDRKVLVEIAREREANISRKAVDVLDMQITDVIRQIREHKQKNAATKESLIEMPDMPVLNVSLYFFKSVKYYCLICDFIYSKIIIASFLDGTNPKYSFLQLPFPTMVVISRQSLKFSAIKLKAKLDSTILQIKIDLKASCRNTIQKMI